MPSLIPPSGLDSLPPLSFGTLTDRQLLELMAEMHAATEKAASAMSNISRASTRYVGLLETIADIESIIGDCLRVMLDRAAIMLDQPF